MKLLVQGLCNPGKLCLQTEMAVVMTTMLQRGYCSYQSVNSACECLQARQTTVLSTILTAQVPGL